MMDAPDLLYGDTAGGCDTTYNGTRRICPYYEQCAAIVAHACAVTKAADAADAKSNPGAAELWGVMCTFRVSEQAAWSRAVERITGVPKRKPERKGQSCFNAEQAAAIRRLYKAGRHSQYRLSQMFYCSAGTISRVINRVGVYAHI